MKLFWKLLSGMLVIIILSFAVFATVLLQSSLQHSLDKETKNGIEEMRVLQYAFLAAIEGLSESYTVDERTVGRLAESVAANASDGRSAICVYNAGGLSVYPAGRRAGELFDMLSLKEPVKTRSRCVWRLVRENDGRAMVAMARIDCLGQEYYLEVRRDIQDIYDRWEEDYRNYRTTLLTLALLAVVLTSVFAAGFTAPVRKLSLAARDFSEGAYGRRVKVRGNDEITALMRDFNGMADRLESNIRALEEHARRQEEFTGAFAHELKTPLTSIIGYSQMLRTMELDEEDRRLAADYVYQEGRRIERLSRKMMELIRVGKLGAERQRVETKRLSRLLEKYAGVRLAEKNIDFCIRLEPAVLWGDMDLLLSLCGNLVDNSRKACKKGGRIRVSGRVEKDGKRYRIQVEDDGQGIPENELDRITEAFYMVDKSRAGKEGGAGLGMAICGRIVEAHGGEWRIESRLGEGTRVSVYLPLDGADERNGDE